MLAVAEKLAQRLLEPEEVEADALHHVRKYVTDEREEQLASSDRQPANESAPQHRRQHLGLGFSQVTVPERHAGLLEWAASVTARFFPVTAACLLADKRWLDRQLEGE